MALSACATSKKNIEISKEPVKEKIQLSDSLLDCPLIYQVPDDIENWSELDFFVFSKIYLYDLNELNDKCHNNMEGVKKSLDIFNK